MTVAVPTKLKIKDLWWKIALRAVNKGKNLLVVGPTGCGKTTLAYELQKATGRDLYYMNLGSSQDPRSTLIGNTHYDKDKGTFVSLSYFAQAIQKPNAIILLDEMSRAHPEAGNILMTVLDRKQGYLRVDEQVDSETIKVAEGVCFIATANVGAEYTSTRTMDRALWDRFTIIEMAPLGYEDELDNLTTLFPNPAIADTLGKLARIAHATREEMKSESPKIDTLISTRVNEEAGELVADGMTLEEVAEVCIYPMYSDAGGADSHRTYIRQIVQKELSPEGNSENNGQSGIKYPWEV